MKTGINSNGTIHHNTCITALELAYPVPLMQYCSRARLSPKLYILLKINACIHFIVWCTPTELTEVVGLQLYCLGHELATVL